MFTQRFPEEWGFTEENAEGPLLSGPLPMGMNRRPLAMPGLLLAGDAGGIVNPFTGEGIAYAMESGELAAELVHESLVKRRPGLAHLYPIELRRRYGRYFTAGRAFARAIGNAWFMRNAVTHGFPRERLMRFLLRVLSNVTDGKDGDIDDRLMDLVIRIMPER
jgi:flavin-dependent dehydrogenase